MTPAIVGTGGIGSAIARQLAAGGETLQLSRADKESARKLAAAIGGAAVVALNSRSALQGADAVVLALRFSVLKDVIGEIASVLGDTSLVVPENGSSCHFANHAVSGARALGVLANNGGPTQTMAITTASPAFDTASLAVCSAVTPSGAGGVDQRGVSRTPTAAETACDIGAFEVQPAAPPVIVMPRFTG